MTHVTILNSTPTANIRLSANRTTSSVTRQLTTAPTTTIPGTTSPATFCHRATGSAADRSGRSSASS